jgi:hypothetical protein
LGTLKVDKLDYECCIKVGDKYLQPAVPAAVKGDGTQKKAADVKQKACNAILKLMIDYMLAPGLKWPETEEKAGKDATGLQIINEAPSAALKLQKTVFTRHELWGSGVRDLSVTCYVIAGDKCFRPDAAASRQLLAASLTVDELHSICEACKKHIPADRRWQGNNGPARALLVATATRAILSPASLRDCSHALEESLAPMGHGGWGWLDLVLAVHRCEGEPR